MSIIFMMVAPPEIEGWIFALVYFLLVGYDGLIVWACIKALRKGK